MSKSAPSAAFAADTTTNNPHGVWRRPENYRPSPPRRLLDEETADRLVREAATTMGDVPLAGTSNIRGFGHRMSRLK